MSFESADIYITRDKFAQGEMNGQLVCAIFVNDPGFVEVTVHPADGGRFFETPPPSSAPAPSDGISREEAVDAASAALPDADEWEVVVATAGPIGQIELPLESVDWARDLPADLWVWEVFIVRGDRGLHVVIDFVDGSVYGEVESIVN